MRVLFAGDDWYGSNARSLADGFRMAGHDVIVVDTTAVTLPKRGTPAWWYAKATKRRDPRTIEHVHAQLDAVATEFRPDLLFCYKSIYLDQDRLLNVPAAIRAHYSADDVSNPYNTTPAYLAAEAGWDAIITTKAHNVSEIEARGGRNVMFVFSAYDPAWHHPAARRGDARYAAGFIGAMRPDRTELLAGLAARYRDDFFLAGPGWRRSPKISATRAVLAGAQYGEHLSAAIARVRANLVLLNSDNRDTHTCRTFEVPAAGGLFVGERTVEHEALLTDGEEAFLFDTQEELVEIIDRCSSEPKLAEAVAERGYRAITQGNHSYRHRAEEMVCGLR